MPRIDRLRRARNTPGLTPKQELELLIGRAGKSAFRDEAARRRAWFENRDELMAQHGRGWAWIVYSGGGFLAGDGGRVTRAIQRIDATK